VIQQEGNGVICGDPKASKSLLSVHLIAHLISGTPWFGHAIRERVKVGLVTREDAPGLTKSRIGRLIRGERLQNISSLDGWLWINSREQTKTFDILDDSEFNMLVRQFKKKECRIVFFDVFNRIHTMNENDNQEMSRVTARLSLFGAEVGCQVGLIHHLNKDVNTGNIFNRLRGAGALHGWMEWGMAVTLTNPANPQNEWVRRVSFESKETAVDDLHYQIEGGPSDGYVSLIQVPDNPVAMHTPRGYRAPRNVERIA
jgi:RecA-family ATPase